MSSNSQIRISLNFFLLVLVTLMILADACTTVPIPETATQTPPPGQPDQPSQSPPSIEELLPKPIITTNSVELCLNNRYSEHSLTGTANNQQIANILWAAGMAPITGSSRNIYISTPAGEYLYSPETHSLSQHSDQRVTGGAFVINCESEIPFDTGVAYMLATLSSVSLQNSSESAVANCPKHTSLYFGVQEVKGLTSELVAHSSVPKDDPGWLPDPSTNGQNKLEEVLADLKYVSQFSKENLPLQQVSQLLWAGYGCTPHIAALGGKKGLTVPSAMAEYYLTGTIYLANEKGVYRYLNRNPSTDMTTRDHRIELISSGDAREELRSALSGLPNAPFYLIICVKGKNLSDTDQVKIWALMETGFVSANVLIQASAIGLGCNFETILNADEQAGIQKVMGLPSSDIPQVIISIGNLAK